MPSKKANKLCLLKMSVPRMEARGPLAFEQILASLHGLLSFESKGGDESISFEMVKMDRKIYFYAAVPWHLRTMIKSQFYAQYPDCLIEESPDYMTTKFTRGKKILVADMHLESPELFPIKRYPQFQDSNTRLLEDPLGPITAAISHTHSRNDHCVIQIVVKPIEPTWNEIAERVCRNLFATGIWKWKKFRNFYFKKRLSHQKKSRIVWSPVWKMMEIFGIFAKIPAINESRMDDETQQLERDARTTAKHDRETTFGSVYDKITRLGFGVNIRAVYAHTDPSPLHAKAKIREILGTFKQFSLPQSNSFGLKTLEDHDKGIFRDFVERKLINGFALSQEELATVYHLPTETVTSPSIQWIGAPTLEPPSDLPDAADEEITVMGKTNFRDNKHEYGIKPVDRRRHVYIIGKTGMGKSTLLENMIFSDIQKGKGVGVIDPHGDLADAVMRFVPKNRTNDVILFDPADREFPIAFNMLEGKDPATRGLIASGLVGVIKKMFSDSWGPRLEYFLRNTILALVEAPDTTLLGIQRMLVDPIYQNKILHHVKDPMVLNFWKNEFQKLEPRQRNEAVGPIQNKVGQFLSTPTIRNILGQPKSTINLRQAMDEGKIVIINLSKGKIGEDNSALLGSMLITKFQLDAMSRADQKSEDRKDFYLYVDEFQNFATDSFATILSEARKYKLNLTMANQYVAQMSEDVAAAVFGNVGSLVSFQVGIDDAQVFATQFDENRITPIALASLPKSQAYNRIMVDGITSPVFSADMLPPPVPHDPNPEARAEKVRNASRKRYTKPRQVVEDKINRWSKDENDKKRKKG